MSDVDALFEVARVATARANGGWPALGTVAACTAVERAVRADWAAVATALTQRDPSSPFALMATAAATGPCQAGLCTGIAVPAVRVFTTGGGTPGLRHATTGLPLHVCVPAFCRRPAAAHAHECTDDVRAAGVPWAQPSTSGGGLFFCARHGRMHVCMPRTCVHRHQTALGATECVLSGQTLEASADFQYGGGVAVLSREAAQQRRVDANVARRNAGGSAADRRRAQANGTAALTSVMARKRVADAPADLDYPAADLWPEHADDNTFGNSQDMAAVYTQCYATVEFIIFSGARAALEADIDATRTRNALTEMQRYADDCRKSGVPVVLSVCQQLQDRALGRTKKRYDQLLVPSGAVPRMRAYFACVAMEWYLQVTGAVKRLLAGVGVTARLVQGTRQTFDRLLALNLADVAPNVYDLMHEGLRHTGRVVVQQDRVLAALFPESLTLQKLGFRQKMCTDVKKLLKRTVLLLVDCGVPVHALQTTTLPLNSVLHAGPPVTTTFLAARRARLAVPE